MLKRHFWWLFLLTAIWSLLEVPDFFFTETPARLFEGMPRRLLGAYLPAWFFASPAGALFTSQLARNWLGSLLPENLLSFLYELFVLGPAYYGLCLVYLRVARHERASFGNLFAPFGRAYLASLISSFLVDELSALGAVLFVIPGILVAVRLSFVPFLVMDERLGAIEALRESWRRTKGYGWTIFGLWLRGTVFILLGVLLLLVGAVPMGMWVMLAYASLYAAVAAREKRRAAGLPEYY